MKQKQKSRCGIEDRPWRRRSEEETREETKKKEEREEEEGAGRLSFRSLADSAAANKLEKDREKKNERSFFVG